MGYTHYYHKDGCDNFTNQEWDGVVEFTKKAIEKTNVPMAGGDGTGDPILTDEEISINGVGNDSHETFYLTKIKHRDFEFCKTVRKPYDEVVCAISWYLKKNLPNKIKIGSDGEFGNTEWKRGRSLYKRAMES